MMSEKYNHISMDKKNLKKLSKSELINLLLKQHKSKIVVVDDTKPVPTPRKSVKDMVQQYEDNIIIPPPEFRDDYKPIPAPRTKKPSEKPVPEKRTIISQVEKALKGYTQSFDVELRDKKRSITSITKIKKSS